MLLPRPSLWCSVGFRKWEGPGMLPPAWPKPTSVPALEASDWPRGSALRTGGQPASDSPCGASIGKGGNSPACPGHPVSSPIGRELEVGAGEGETLPDVSGEGPWAMWTRQLWITDFRKSGWTQTGPMREELQWLSAGLAKSGWWE